MDNVTVFELLFQLTTHSNGNTYISPTCITTSVNIIKPPRENKFNLYPQEDILIQKTNPKYVPIMCKLMEV